MSNPDFLNFLFPLALKGDTVSNILDLTQHFVADAPMKKKKKIVLPNLRVFLGHLEQK